MTSTTVRDDARDAIALIRTCLNDDIEAAEIIHANCNLGGVLAIMTGIAAEGLIGTKGADGAREWLDRMQRQGADGS